MQKRACGVNTGQDVGEWLSVGQEAIAPRSVLAALLLHVCRGCVLVLTSSVLQLELDVQINPHHNNSNKISPSHFSE